MKKLFVLICVLVIIAGIIGCTYVYKNYGKNNGSTKTTGKGSLYVKANGLNLPDNKSLQKAAGNEENSVIVGALPENIIKVTVTIIGENIPSPIIYDLVKINGDWKGIIGNIPAGPATLDAKAYDDSDELLYENTVEITIVNNEIINLNMILQPSDPPDGYQVKAPRIDLVNISPQKVAPGDVVKLEVIAHDPEPSGPLTYVWTPQDIGVFDDRTSPTPEWTAPADEGIYQLTITVIDVEFLIDHFTINIEVDDKYGDGYADITLGTNDYPVITSMIADPTRIDKGETTQLLVNAYDPDGNTLTYSWSSDLLGTFDDNTSVNPLFTIDSSVDYGPCVITVDVSDGTLTTSGSIQINITDDPDYNIAPTVISAFQADDIVSPNGKLAFSVRAKDPEGSNVTFTWLANGGSFDTQQDTTEGLEFISSIEWTAPATATEPFIITVQISDSEGLVTTLNFLPITLQ